MLSQAVQDYLKSIYKLQKVGPVSTTEISKDMNVSGASVTGMLKRLSVMGFVDYSSYKGVSLTDTGEKIALEIIRHHRLLELYLKEVMGYSLEKVHDEACRLEHFISEEFEDRISDMLGNPQFDPHGHPIPSKEGNIPAMSELKLSEADINKDLTISRLSDSDEKLLAYLEDIGLVPHVKIKVLDREPFKGPLKVLINEKEKIIGDHVAGNIFVEEIV